MAAPPTSTAAHTSDLDALDTTDKMRAFEDTLLGSLPNELLQIITRCLGRRDLTAVARVHPRLRALAERPLYPSVTIPYEPAIDEEYGYRQGEELWPLCRTLSHRQDLADKIRNMDLTVLDRNINIEIPAAGLLPSHMPFTSTVSATIKEARVAGMLLPRLSKATRLDMNLVRYFPPGPRWTDDDYDIAEDPMLRVPLIRGALGCLFSAFDASTAHLVSPPILPNLESFTYNGDEFHWALAKSPRLESLWLQRPCRFLQDSAPDEVNLSLAFLTLSSRSSILNPRAGQLEPLLQFIAHFPVMSFLSLTIQDKDYDNHVDVTGELSRDEPVTFQELIRLLHPIISSLQTLEVGPCIFEDHDADQYLEYVSPSAGFKDFDALQHLSVPYHCLFGVQDSQWSHITRPPSQLFPATLPSLSLYYPRIEVYDWLARIPDFRDEIPVLEQVILYCSPVYGDSYEMFAYMSYPDPVLAALKSIGVDLELYCYDERNDAWLEYDLKALDYLLSFNECGPSPSGIVLDSHRSKPAAAEPDEDLRTTIRQCTGLP